MNGRYKELSDSAFNLHHSGQFDEAERLYNLLLEMNPDDINVLNLMGMLYISKKEYNKAIAKLSKASVLKPTTYIVSNLAKAYYMNNEFEKSLKLYKMIEQSEDVDDDVFYSMALVYKKLNDIDKAKEYYLKSIRLNPNKYSAIYNLAIIYRNLKDYDLAIETALKALNINDKDEDIHSLLANLYEETSNYENALNELLTAHKLNPNQALYVYNIGVLYNKLSDKNNSIKYYKKALELKPDYTDALVNLYYQYKDTDQKESYEYIKKAYKISPDAVNVNLALAQYYKNINKNNESLKILNQLLNKYPENADALNLTAINYMDKGKYKLSLEYFEKAIKIMPDNLNFMHGKAMAYKYLGDKESAKKILEKIVKNKNISPSTLASLGMLYLSEKNFYDGMEYYCARSSETKFSLLFKNKIWKKGTDIKDKVVLLYCDCGLGDTIMFARYLPELQKIAKKVILQTDKELIEIIKSNYKGIEVISKTMPRGEYDIVMSIMQISYALNMDFNNIPYSNGYLSADKKLINKYKDLEVFNTNKLKAGIFYQGNKKVFKNRSIPYRYLKELNENQLLQLYSFQIANYEKEDENIINFREIIKDYNDTAALLNCIDVLITIDSSIAHMAGALGIKTILLLPYTPEWRWFDDNEKTCWYDSIKIIKQDKTCKWKNVIEKVKSEISEYAAQREIQSKNRKNA